MSDPLKGFLLAGFVVFVFLVYYLRQIKSRRMATEWLERDGYRVASLSYCWILRGPFSWTSSKGQDVYKVEARDREGRVRVGYVRCGSYWLGLWSDHVEVAWDS